MTCWSNNPTKEGIIKNWEKGYERKKCPITKELHPASKGREVFSKKVRLWGVRVTQTKRRERATWACEWHGERSVMGENMAYLRDWKHKPSVPGWKREETRPVCLTGRRRNHSGRQGWKRRGQRNLETPMGLDKHYDLQSQSKENQQKT